MKRSTFPWVGFASSVFLALLLPVHAHAQSTKLIFGLTNTPIGLATLDVRGQQLAVSSMMPTPGGVFPGSPPLTGVPGPAFLLEGGYGVSVELGSADAGVFISPTTQQWLEMGAFMIGKAFGEVDGQASQLISVVGASKQREGAYTVWVDFSSIGAYSAVYEVYDRDRLVTRRTNQSLPFCICTDSEYNPRANPFWRLADGGIAAVIELTRVAAVTLPASTDGEYGSVYGDRVLVRPLDPAAAVGSASRVEVTAGGFNEFLVTDERLGVFGHAHRALGSARFSAAPGVLTVDTVPEAADEDTGVLVEIEQARTFSMDVRPIDLSGHGASIVVAAVASSSQGGSEFIGFAGVRNNGGALAVFANLALSENGLSVAVYREHCEVARSTSPDYAPSVAVAGAPRVVGWEASANLGDRRPSLGVRFDQTATFTLPGGALVVGDEIRFRSTAPYAVEKLTGVSLLWSNLSAVSIVGETREEAINLPDYFPELLASASRKLFHGSFDGAAQTFARTTALTPFAEGAPVVVDETLPAAWRRPQTFSLRAEGLFYHGHGDAVAGLFSTEGLRLLPSRPEPGRTYHAVGSFDWRNTSSGVATPVLVTASTRVPGFEILSVPAWSNLALRVETDFSFSASAEADAPTARRTTNWLAESVGVLAFAESEDFAAAPSRHRSGEVLSYSLLRGPVLRPEANIGASVTLRANVTTDSGSVPAFAWRHNGVPLADTGYDSISLVDLRTNDAGFYSVTVSNLAGELPGHVGFLSTPAFSEVPGSRVWSGVGSGYLFGQHVAADAAGNVYLAGTIRGGLAFGSFSITQSLQDDTLYVVKFDSSGNPLWLRIPVGLPGVSGESIAGLGTDSAGNLYLAGTYQGSLTFGGITLTAQAERTENGFAAKLTPDGDWAWAVSMTSTNAVRPTSAAVDASGRQFIAGALYGTLSLGTNVLHVLPDEGEIFVTMVNSNGQFVWAVKGASPGMYSFPDVNTVAADGAGGVYLAGTFSQSLALGGLNLAVGTNNGSGFLVRLDGGGQTVWGRGGLTYSLSLATSANGDLYLHGPFVSPFHLGPFFLTPRGYSGYGDNYLARLRPDGSVVWARMADSLSGYGKSLVVDPTGNVYTAGTFYNEAVVGDTTFQGGWGNSTLLSKFDAEGRRIWSKHINALNGAGTIRDSMTRDAAGNLLLAGQFYYSVIIGETNLSGNGSPSPYILRMPTATAPAITQQPQSVVSAPGGSATFTVIATGTPPLHYQWQRDGVDVTGAVGPTYTIPGVQPANAGAYTLVVRNQGGIAASQPARLDVTSPDAGTVQFATAAYATAEGGGVASVAIVRSGALSQLANFSVETADGSAHADLDYVAAVGHLTFLPGESTKTFTVPILNDGSYEAPETITLRLCHAGPGVTLGALPSAVLTITDDDPPVPVILSHPRPRMVGVGGSVTFSVTANGEAPLLYQWRNGVTDLPGATNSTLALAGVQPADSGVYSVRVFNGSGSVVSSGAALTVVPLPVILVQPQDALVPYGDPTLFSVVASSSVQVNAQSFARVSTDTLRDVLRVPNTIRRGVLSLNIDLGLEPDELQAFIGNRQVYGIYATGRLDVVEVAFDYSYPPPIEIVVIPVDNGAADGWSYAGEIASQPLRYRWRMNAREIAGANGTNLYLGFTSQMFTGAYSVVVSDAVGTVTSRDALLTLGPPVINIERIDTSAWQPPPDDALLRLWWTSPDHFAERRLLLPTGAWDWAPMPWNGAYIQATNSQEYFRLRLGRPPMMMGGGD